MATVTPEREQDGAARHPSGDADPVAAPPRACASCGAALAPEQDWCLECGTAAPGRLGSRPGMRGAVAVAVLTLLLVGGAVAAGYAALSGDANRRARATTPADASPVANAAPVIPDVPAPTPAPKLPKTPAPKLPSVSTPVPIAPLPTTPPAVTPSIPPATTTPKGTSTTTTPPTKTTPAPAAPQPLKALAIPAGGAVLYDPYQRATDPGDPAAAIDKDPATVFSVTTAADGKDQQVGLLVDLGTVKNVRAVELVTSTPGGTVEVYGADGSAVPADILDPRWTHLGARKQIDRDSKAGNTPNDGKEEIRLATPGAASADSGARLRRILLWFTKAPSAGATVRISELKVLG